MKTLNGQLLFFNADDNEILGEDEHFMCTDIVWDPTGRYVTYLCISIGYINGTVVYSSCKHCSLLL
jgi:translation initiation factor 3 subunit B